MVRRLPVSPRAACIEYAIRDVVVPATALERQGHEILKLNIGDPLRSEEHTSELQSRRNLVCRLLLEKKQQSLQTIVYRLTPAKTYD